jgi:hypothetical protein
MPQNGVGGLLRIRAVHCFVETMIPLKWCQFNLLSARKRFTVAAWFRKRFRNTSTKGADKSWAL